MAYAYRHTYAQRHADAGTPIEVLRELMGHRSVHSTDAYYRITETRTRAAVNPPRNADRAPSSRDPRDIRASGR